MKGIEVAFDARITRDAEIKTARTGRTFLKFSVVHSKGEGEKLKETWLSVLAWRESIAELCPDLKAGVEVYIEGEIEQTQWESPEGSRTGLSVSASKVEPKGLIGRKKPKAAPKPRGKPKGAVDSQAPIKLHATPFNDELPI